MCSCELRSVSILTHLSRAGFSEARQLPAAAASAAAQTDRTKDPAASAVGGAVEVGRRAIGEWETGKGAYWVESFCYHILTLLRVRGFNKNPPWQDTCMALV